MAHRTQPDLLSERELLYVEAWRGNGKKAATAAGYPSPRVQSSRLLQRPRVVKALQQKQLELIRFSAFVLALPADYEELRTAQRLMATALRRFSAVAPGSAGGAIATAGGSTRGDTN